MTLREKLELAGYRLRALAAHMPTEWQKNVAMSWADDAVRASGMLTEGGDAKQAPGDSLSSPVPQADAQGDAA
jgi:hypothetical protein